MPEAEPGFVGAALEGLDGSGYRLVGRALRAAESQAVLEWVRDRAPGQSARASQLRAEMEPAITSALRARGEPSPYSLVHAAGWSDLAARRRLAPDRPAEDTRTATEVNDVLEAVLGDHSVFVRLGAGAEAEVGLYWLTDPDNSAPPLTERSEALILRLLREATPMSEIEVDERVCAELTGLQTPDRRWVRTCLEFVRLAG